MDNELRIINATSPEQFEQEVNKLLFEGYWRVVETEMSVTDSHYWAMLIQSKIENIEVKRG
jgi:hypothetical protein